MGRREEGATLNFSYTSPAKLRLVLATPDKLIRLLIDSVWTLRSYEPRSRLLEIPHLSRLSLTHSRSGLLQEALTMNLAVLTYVS